MWATRRFERMEAALVEARASPYPIRRWMIALFVEHGIVTLTVAAVGLVVLFTPWDLHSWTFLVVGWSLISVTLFDILWLGTFHRWRRRTQPRE